MIRRLKNTVKALISELMRYKKSPLRTLVNWHNAYRHGLFSPSEIRLYGLADPSEGAKRQKSYGSKEIADSFYHKYNPVHALKIISDKLIFEERCRKNDRAIPTTYGTYMNGEVKTPDGKIYKGRQELEKFFSMCLATPCVLKPNNGFLGQNMFGLHRLENGSIDINGEIISSNELLDRLLGDTEQASDDIKHSASAFQGLMIQKRLRNHDDISYMTGFDMLQTVRICTFVNDDNEVKVLFCFYKIAGEEGLADAFSLGKTGNMAAEVNVETGQLKDVYILDFEKNYFRTVSKNPKTGVDMAGFQLPHWQACLDLVEKLAIDFLPLRTLGWDFAITDEGPVVLEGNENWTPMVPFHLSYDEIRSYGLK